MSEAAELLLELLRSVLCGRRPAADAFRTVTDTRWEAVYKLSVRQGVLALAYDGIESLPAECRPPKALLLQWGYNTQLVERRNRRQAEALEELSEVFFRHRIPVMLLKGAGLARMYPVPEHRPCGDLDIWLYGRHEESLEVISEELHADIRYDSEHHTKFTYRGITVENHYDLINTRIHRSSSALERVLRQEAGTPVPGRKIHFPPPDFNALFLIRHMASHFAAEYITLRHLCDWAVFMNACSGEVDWPRIRRIYEDYNLVHFAGAVDCLLGDCFGTVVRGDSQAAEERPLAEKIMFDILEANPEKTASGLGKVMRWMKNRWKFRIAYPDSLLQTFVNSCRVHLPGCKTSIRKKLKI